MRQLDYLKMNTVQWKNVGTEHHYNLSVWLDAAVKLEDTLRELDSELGEFGGIGFVSQDEHTNRIMEILTVLRDCRQWLDKDIEDFVDRPLKEIFNALDDELASIDSRKIKTPNLAGDKAAVKYDDCGMPYEEGTLAAPKLLTLEDFTGSSMGKSQGFLIYNQKITGFADIMEERYNYTVTDAESEISYKDYIRWYEPSESYFKKDASFWARMAQTAWSATGIGDLIDSSLGYELITGDRNTLEESDRKAAEGMLETALLCLPGVMNAGGGGKAVLYAVGKELGENIVTDTMYEALEAGGCEEAREILNAVLVFRTIYSLADIANSAVNAKSLKDAYKGKKGAYSNLDDGLNFSNKALEHMEDSVRQIPMQTLQDVIRYGDAFPDPRGSSALMYYTVIYRNGKIYNLEVLYDEITNTVYHFEYARRKMGNLPAISK